MSRHRLVLAVEPSRLPPSDRLRKGHGRESAFVPQLNPKTRTHLNDLGPLIIRTRLFHCLRAAGEYVLEETPVRSTTQEGLAHIHLSLTDSKKGESG